MLGECRNLNFQKWIISDSPMSHKPPQDLDMNKLYSMPSKLVATCEQTLFKRKEIIDWFETLKTVDKVCWIPMNWETYL